MNILTKIASMPRIMVNGLSYHITDSLSGALPKLLMFVITRKCNSRCVMCRSWRDDNRQDDLTTDEIRRMFSHSYFRELEGVIISGGEPTLRKDLPEIVKAIYDSCPKMKFIWTSSNGFNTDILEERLAELLLSIGYNRAEQITFNISIDGLQDTHDAIRGVNGGYERAMRSLEFLTSIRKKYPIQVTINTVIQPQNIRELDDIKKMSSELGVTAVFSPLINDAFFASENVASDMNFSEEEMRIFRDFIRRSFGRSLAPVGLYWDTFLKMLDGKRRDIPCGFDRHAVVVEPDGNLRICTMRDWTLIGNFRDGFSSEEIIRKSRSIRHELKEKVCNRCPNYCTAEFAIEKEFFRYAGFLLKRIFKRFSVESGVEINEPGDSL
jgi:MoaA/NifB/PqqE/SkfB family radical SAM enzyme